MTTENTEAQAEAVPTETKEVQEEALVTAEQAKVSLHIYMPTEEYERVKKWARYAAIEGLIEGHPRGNFTDYCNFCFSLGEEYLKQYILKKRGFR